MYSPKIYPDQIRKLYLLKMSYVSLGISKPMTEIVEEALDEYIPKAVKEILESGGTLLMPDELTLKGVSVNPHRPEISGQDEGASTILKGGMSYGKDSNSKKTEDL